MQETASWEAPLEGEGRLTLNAVPVFLNVLFDNPAAVLSGKPAKTRSRLESRHLTGKIDLTLSQAGNPVLNGDVSVEIPSAASFAQWLGQPLAAEKDPGRVTLSARLASEGSATTLEELRIEGDDWQVMGLVIISGSILLLAAAVLVLRYGSARFPAVKLLDEPDLQETGRSANKATP